MSEPIKVALIDDGVRTDYAGLDSSIVYGDCMPRQPKSGIQESRRYNYNSSRTGHGTVMAYFIRRICPQIQLYIAKLAPNVGKTDDPDRDRVTFSGEAAADVSQWI